MAIQSQRLFGALLLALALIPFAAPATNALPLYPDLPLKCTLSSLDEDPQHQSAQTDGQDDDPFYPQTKFCPDLTGHCVITETTAVTVNGELSHDYTFWDARLDHRLDATTSTEIITTVDCRGEYDLVTWHFGGMGVRTAAARLLAKAPDGGADGLASAPAINLLAQDTRCGYVGGLTACTTNHHGEWATHRQYSGRLVAMSGEIAACAVVDILNTDVENPQGGLPPLADLVAPVTVCGSVAGPEPMYIALV